MPDFFSGGYIEGKLLLKLQHLHGDDSFTVIRVKAK